MPVPQPSAATGTDSYRRVLDVLEAESVEFLVGGAFALNSLAGIERDTKDLDLMLRPRDVDRVSRSAAPPVPGLVAEIESRV